MVVDWSSLLVPGSVMFHPAPMVDTGPRVRSGKQQVVGTDAGFWKATLSDFIIRRPEHILEWRGIIADLQGALNDLVIGPFDCRQAPKIPGVPVVKKGIPHSDGSMFSDGSGYSQASIKIIAKGNAALRASSMTMTILDAGKLFRGMFFSVTNPLDPLRPRLHLITRTPEVTGSDVVVRFFPLLRFPVANGAEINFSNPRGTMSLASVSTGQLDVRMRRFSSPSLELEESWNGLS